ncbi:MAG: tRNA (adenosine(37)-N6)-threonylcarbamoyltransferase complex ATPase subunit type 1 TsaE [Candidatus Saccharimonadales bacterium]
MSQTINQQITVTAPLQTEEIAAKIGAQLKGGELIELVSDLGGGKTTFVRGLSRGAGSADHVSSPTFTISKQYQAGPLTIYHFDFYRLPDAGLMEHELAELIGQPKIVIVVEWADVVQAVFPTQYLQVKLELLPGADQESSRQLSFSYPPKLSYLLESVKK